MPVSEFLYSLPIKLRAKAFRDIELLQKHGNELREPYVKPVKGKYGKGLYELRIIKGGFKMSRAGVSFESIKAQLMADADFAEEYDRLRPRYEVISQIIAARREMNMTQEELAKKIGTQKSNISRLESGNYNPSLDFLIKVAAGLGKELKIQML